MHYSLLVRVLVLLKYSYIYFTFMIYIKLHLSFDYFRLYLWKFWFKIGSRWLVQNCGWYSCCCKFNSFSGSFRKFLTVLNYRLHDFLEKLNLHSKIIVKLLFYVFLTPPALHGVAVVGSMCGVVFFFFFFLLVGFQVPKEGWSTTK